MNGRQILEQLELLNMSQKELAKEIGVSPSTINRVIHDNKLLTRSKYYRMCGVFGVVPYF